MRIVVIGATGNVGTAVLRRLHDAPEVTQLVGIARRLPDEARAPYSGVSWASVDLASTTATSELASLFVGADAVIHLGWALQPNHDESAMRETNVGGTARVLAAAAEANVAQVVVASSVGAYSFGPKRSRVDETWPTGGMATSHYARHKAANERALDRFEAQHPEILVTRMRPGLVFQKDAGVEIARLFLGSHVPTRWLAHWRPPILPFPSEGIFQAIHADDLADAFWRAIQRRAGGAFNIAAEPVLTPQLIAETIGARRWQPVRMVAIRRLVEVTWRLRLQATDAGWIDIATQVPVMSTTRAREILGWEPSISSTEALADVIDGMAHRVAVPGSAPLSG